MELPGEAVTPDGRGGAFAELLVQPGASRTAVVGVLEGRIKIAVAAPPVDGKANAELLKFLRKLLRVPAGGLAIVAGESGRRKRLRAAMPPGELREKLSGGA